MKSLFVLLLSSFILSCSTMSKNQCANADWYSLGYDDLLVKSRDNTYFYQREKACGKHKLTANKNEYLKGWNDAIIKYCSKDNLYNIGLKGYEFVNTCGEEKYDSLIEHYRRGKRLFEINKLINKNGVEINNLKYRRNNSNLTDYEKMDIDRKISHLEYEIKMYELEKIKLAN